mmetsp:Transcript_4649/g.9924  ORF Transcript_4649/g.9924 Transcript_4649/m.9924 type:complete len:100 (+) Transcript_4649:76-375(+)
MIYTCCCTLAFIPRKAKLSARGFKGCKHSLSSFYLQHKRLPQGKMHSFSPLEGRGWRDPECFAPRHFNLSLHFRTFRSLENKTRDYSGGLACASTWQCL